MSKTILTFAFLMLVASYTPANTWVSVPTYGGDSIILEGSPSDLKITKVSNGSVRWVSTTSLWDFEEDWGQDCSRQTSITSCYYYGILVGWNVFIKDEEYCTMLTLHPDCTVKVQESYLLVTTDEEAVETIEITLSNVVY